jgi:enoyl-CoA hydratase/carnithine racemase
MKTDYKTIQVDLRGHAAVFTMNNPPVNQLSPQFQMDLAKAFMKAYGDDGVKTIVITGFCATRINGGLKTCMIC